MPSEATADQTCDAVVSVRWLRRWEGAAGVEPTQDVGVGMICVQVSMSRESVRVSCGRFVVWNHGLWHAAIISPADGGPTQTSDPSAAPIRKLRPIELLEVLMKVPQSTSEVSVDSHETCGDCVMELCWFRLVQAPTGGESMFE